MFLILASASPRRAELLKQVGIEFEICSADVDETVDENLSPSETVITLSQRKAKAAFDKLASERGENLKKTPILAADTLVELDGKMLGKPRDEKEAKKMLEALSDRTHRVYSGITVAFDGKIVSRAVCTEVVFGKLSNEDIAWYIATGEPLDKAGAYGIQGKGALWVKEIHGDYNNVVGLPLNELYALLKEEPEIGN